MRQLPSKASSLAKPAYSQRKSHHCILWVVTPALSVINLYLVENSFGKCNIMMDDLSTLMAYQMLDARYLILDG